MHRDRQPDLSGERRELKQLHSPACRGESVLGSWSLLVRLESFSTPLRCLSLYSFLFLASCVFLSLLLVFFLTSCFLSCTSSLYPFFPFLSLSRILHLLSLWADSPSALILLCTVLLQMRQARRLSNPCIQRYTSRIGECSSTYVSSSKSPLQTISSPFLILFSTHWLALCGCRYYESSSDLAAHLMLPFF